MQFMQLSPMQKNNNQQQMTSLLQAALARNAQQPQVPQPGQVMPGGAMNIMPQVPKMGMLGGLLSKLMPQQGAAPVGAPMEMPDSTNALY